MYLHADMPLKEGALAQATGAKSEQDLYRSRSSSTR